MKKIITFITLILISACSTNTNRIYGNLISDDDMLSIEEGLSTKNDLIVLFGQPSAKSSFDKNTWYYMGESVKLKSFLTPEIQERRIIEVKFDDDNTVSFIRGYDLSDAKEIKIDPKQTSSLGTSKSELQEFIGNLGKFNQNVVKQQ
jgi:outer membrane protein assembly factor BamE (lipoprotein component of BamABCDE complex)